MDTHETTTRDQGDAVLTADPPGDGGAGEESTGRILQVIGAVVDVAFDAHTLPAIHSALVLKVADRAVVL